MLNHDSTGERHLRSDVRSILCCFALLLVAFAQSVTPQAPSGAARKIALVGGMLLDGYEAPPIHHAAVLIDGDRIVRVGPAAAMTIPPDYRVIDTSGRTMMPGMIELHAHLSRNALFAVARDNVRLRGALVRNSPPINACQLRKALRSQPSAGTSADHEA